MAGGTPSLKTRAAFASASSGKVKRKLPWKPMVALGVLVVGALIYFVGFPRVMPRMGNAVYGICRVYIEKNLQFPTTLRIIEFDEKIPEGENPSAPQRINHNVTFSSIDGFGQTSLNTVTCGFKFDPKLANTPWNGIILERVLFNGRDSHGWSDVYYPPDKKNPRAADDRSEVLEIFNAGIPAIFANPPDLTLPWHDLKYMKVEDLKDL